MTRGEAVVRLLKVHTTHKKQLDLATRRLASEVARRSAEIAPVASANESEWPALAAAARVARELPLEKRNELLSRMPDGLAQEFERELYAFDALPQLPARVVQEVIRLFPSREIGIALIGADDAVEAAVLDNVSARAATMIREDRESVLAAGELSARDVSAARSRIAEQLCGVARRTQEQYS